MPTTPKKPARPDAARRRREPRRTPKTLDPVHPNEGVRTAYQRKLERLIDDMHGSILYWIRAAYRANTPEAAQAPGQTVRLAADASPARAIQAAVKREARRWQRRFDEAAPELAAWFAQTAAERSDLALAATLKRSGFSVSFKLTPAVNDVLQATTLENVSLIRTIAQQHLAHVEQVVLRNVSTGGDIAKLTDDLLERFAVTRRRAIIIARDQNAKATATVQRVRQKSIGVREAIWMHSHGGKVPRQSHVDFSGQRYDIDKGAFLDGEWVWPGTAINCRCVCRPVLPGFD